MYVALIRRNGEMHILNFTAPDHKYRTMCRKLLSKKTQIITLALDNAIPQLCSICKNKCDQAYAMMVDYNLRMLRNSKQQKYYQLLEHARKGMLGPEDTYSYLKNENRKNWHKTSLEQSRAVSKKKSKDDE